MENSFYPMSLQNETWKQNLSANEKLRTGLFFYTAWKHSGSVQTGDHTGSHTALTVHTCTHAGRELDRRSCSLCSTQQPCTNAHKQPSHQAKLHLPSLAIRQSPALSTRPRFHLSLLSWFCRRQPAPCPPVLVRPLPTPASLLCVDI